MSNRYDNIRIATTEAALLNSYLTYSHRIPAPTVAVYNDHSQKFSATDGGVLRAGFASVRMNFTNLDRWQARKLRALAEDALALAAKRLWLTIDLNWNGSDAPNSWVDVYGVPLVPDISPSSNSNGFLRNAVTLTVNNVVIDNDPATGI